jgi:para-aminobenzoate synthetase component 1
MRPFLEAIETQHTPESLVDRLQGVFGVVLLRSALFDSPQARYSFVTARPFLTFRAFGSRCELRTSRQTRVQFGDPWHVLDGLMARYELLDEVDLPFPLGGCFGFWGYDLKNFVEPKLTRRAVNDLELPDCHVGFHDSLVVFDHRLGKSWIVSTGLRATVPERVPGATRTRLLETSAGQRCRAGVKPRLTARMVALPVVGPTSRGPNSSGKSSGLNNTFAPATSTVLTSRSG